MFDWLYLPRSVVLLSENNKQHWYLLTQGPRTWKLRGYRDNDRFEGEYLPELVNLPEGCVVLQQLGLPQVNELTKSSATTTPHANAAAWKIILGALDGFDEPPQPPVGVAPPADDRVPNRIPATFLRSVYGSMRLFCSLKTQLAMARDLQRGRNCQYLAEWFDASVRHFSQYTNDRDNFVPQIPPRRPLPPVAEITALYGTTALTAIADNGQGCVVEGAPGLSFRYVDREIVPARTTGGALYENGEPATAGKRLDWLLANLRDKTPILAEVKIGDDRNPFYALIQLLMYAAELVTLSQRQRLNRCYPDKFAMPDGVDGEDGRRVDLYIVLADYNGASAVRASLLDEVQGICEQLSAQGVFRQHVRNLACIEADFTPPGQVRWRRRFAFPDTQE